MSKFNVPDMSCGHCKAAVEKAVATVPGVAGMTVDLGAKTVEVLGTAQDGALMAALRAAGYPATPA